MERTDFKHIHLIATGGSIMHNLALALHDQGIKVTGSDDEIYEPAKSRLAAAGILPAEEGWFPEKLDSKPDAVILGMHARADNPELLRAQELGIPVYSFPNFIYELSKNKQRIVIGGSHGKTSITSIIMHVLQHCGRLFDYAVGAQLQGFDRMVKLTEEAPIIIIEGDEYLSDPIKRVPKFHLYHHHIGVISGISWDHINVFPTPEVYRDQFRIFAEMTPKAGTLIYNQDDEQVQLVAVPRNPADIAYIGYTVHPHSIRNGKTILHTKKEGDVEIPLFGEHNLRNISAAKEVCKKIGIKAHDFYEALKTFKGAAKRLEKLGENNNSVIFRDFAHAPSKVKATTEAVKTQYPQRKLVACVELHTFSSLNKNFLPQYAGALDKADVPIVFFSPKTVEHKRMEMLSEEDLRNAFGNPRLQVYTDSNALLEHLKGMDWQNANLLLMSSGTYQNLDLEALKKAVL
ncbi:UDP-N-acetylmuramate--L-alanine ligase [Pontibacter lucknowensis]|uniref:UDP-N-acetylmuramate: L-alanyl-gamma-D-glutamyl-meso-diaminopimelate ligase n=1 Tax=Pontibacter lucknowensis TaxID=1077936 RepID=A0A1N6YKJ0_9BACT|nr:Mur ligase family protein [Pontibacter lucknowensis]SIR15120.1 UDP-N-acetylmuramate: L-alanyl-gamma-D-glutamyl-meso-diaminopimelate ligase [Pontibacter lucknowensis]